MVWKKEHHKCGTIIVIFVIIYSGWFSLFQTRFLHKVFARVTRSNTSNLPFNFIIIHNDFTSRYDFSHWACVHVILVTIDDFPHFQKAFFYLFFYEGYLIIKKSWIEFNKKILISNTKKKVGLSQGFAEVLYIIFVPRLRRTPCRALSNFEMNIV